MTMPDAKTLARQLRDSVGEIGAFVSTPRFRTMLDQMAIMDRQGRELFVQRVLLDDEELATRGILPPEGMVIQRSTFADGRPTLFCVSKYLPDGKRKVTVTFDNEVLGDPVVDEPSLPGASR